MVVGAESGWEAKVKEMEKGELGHNSPSDKGMWVAS